MAWGEKYSIPFKNREQTDCEVKLSAKDYVGDSTELVGSGKPFELSCQSQDNQVPYGIKATEAIIEFYAGSIGLIDFYSEDDTFWKAQFYYDGNLTWTGFLQLDNCSEAFTDIDHIISLNANDGLAKLQNLYLLEQQSDPNVPLYRHWTLQDLFSYIFAFTYSSLDVAAYLNIFENTTDDRSDDPTADLIQQTAIDTKYYINSDGTTFTLYEILNNIMQDFRCCLFQAAGEWVIVRWGDVRLFADGAMPGTRYLGGFGSWETCLYPASINIGRNPPGEHIYDVEPINENQLSRILRPYEFVKETFNYNQPPFINQSDLQIEIGATPFATNTVGDLRYDDYDLSTYFPEWESRNGDTSYLQIVTDTVEKREVERYIVTPGQSVDNCGIEFNAIPVTYGDRLHFSLQFKTDDDDPTYRVYIRFALVLPDDTIRALTPVGTWSAPFDCTDFDTGNYLTVLGETTTDYQQWDLDTVVSNVVVKIPDNGILLIQMNGSNTNNGEEHPDIMWNNLSITFDNFINQQSQIIGQSHNNIQVTDALNNLQFEVTHDDTQRNTITGTLFTSAVTTFCAGVGGVFFTRTSLWHRSDIVEERLLGDLNTSNDLFNQYKVRTIMEGDFYGLTGVSLASIVKFANLDTDKNFIFGVARFDYMSCIWNATFYELYQDGETEDEIILETDANVTTYSTTGVSRPIEFTTAATEIDFSPDGSFIIWTYSGITAPVEIVLNLVGTWDTADVEATLNLKVNGVVVASKVIGDGNPPNDFNITLTYDTTLEDTDTISVSVDWTGATAYTLDIDSGSLQVTRFLFSNTYTFNYIYENV